MGEVIELYSVNIIGPVCHGTGKEVILRSRDSTISDKGTNVLTL